MSATPDTLAGRAALKAFGAAAGAAALVPWLSNDGLLAFEALQKTKTGEL